MKEARSVSKGIRVNGMVTPYADQALFAYLSPMPVASGERMRALKQLAHIGLMAMRGAGAVQSCPPGHTLEPAGCIQKPELTRSMAIAAATEGIIARTFPVSEPNPEGAYDLTGLDLGEIDLPF